MISWTFLKENYFMIGYAVTLMVSLVTYRKYYDTALKYFPIIIAYTFFNEILGFLVRNYDDISFFKNLKYSNVNEIIYNIYAVIFFAFFYHVYWRLIKNTTYKKWVVIAALITLFAYGISLIFQNPIETNLFFAIAIGSWALVFCVILYYYDKLLQHQHLLQPHNLMFWVSLSLLIFYSIFPFLYLIGYTDYETWAEYNLRSVLRALIVIMYGFLIIGFLRGRRLAFR
jgi:hypothetical protein